MEAMDTVMVSMQSVILNAVKDLDAGGEILRCAQDDRTWCLQPARAAFGQNLMGSGYPHHLWTELGVFSLPAPPLDRT
jgi:hypothetical protein